jgi:hypothetical protein
MCKTGFSAAFRHRRLQSTIITKNMIYTFPFASPRIAQEMPYELEGQLKQEYKSI